MQPAEEGPRHIDAMRVVIPLASLAMIMARLVPKDIDAYVAGFSPAVQDVLQRMRRTIHAAAPDAEETISYGIPSFKLNGILVHFAAFKAHIGFYPPVRGDAKLVDAVARYAGEKGNLRFPLDEPIPYDLIEGIVKHRVKQNLAKTAVQKKQR